MYEAVLCKVTATWFPKLWKYVQIYVSEIKKKSFPFLFAFHKKAYLLLLIPFYVYVLCVLRLCSRYFV